MPLLFVILMAWWAGVGIETGVSAADAADAVDFNAALRDFDIQLWDRAEKSFVEFLQHFPQSTFAAEASQRRDFAHAEAVYSKGDFSGAATAFASFQLDYPTSPRAALAAVREASARIQNGDAPGAVKVLEDPQRPFARTLAAGGSPEVLVRGLMMKSQAWLTVPDPARAIATLETARPMVQGPAGQFSFLQALALACEKGGDARAVPSAQEALELAAREPSLSSQRPPSVVFLAEMLSRQGKWSEAAEWYNKNLAAGVAPEFQRQAAFELARLRLKTGDVVGARQRLEAFLGNQQVDPDSLPLRLLLGQVLFKQYQFAMEKTNLTDAGSFLSLAGGQYLQILSNSPPDDIAGPAALGRGWCLWEENALRGATNRLPEAETNFILAARILPRGEERARAQFKAADCQLARHDAATALGNYRQVAEENAGTQSLAGMVESAWRQTSVAAAILKDRPMMLLAREKLLAINSHSELAVRATLLASQTLTRLGDAPAARELLATYLPQLADSPYRPEIELALIASDLRTQRWTNAIAELDHWISANPKNSELPRAVWDRAWAKAQAGKLTNAALEFAQLAAQFPAAPSAGLAQLWLADDYFSRREYDRASLACNLLLTNKAWQGKSEWYRAKFLAAESAIKLENWRDAGSMLLDLLNDKGTPAALVPSTYFALGIYHVNRPPETLKPESGKQSEDPYNEALNAFKAAASFTNSPLSPAALGWMANCNLQKARRATNFIGPAIELYQQVLKHPAADSSVRANAAFGLAQASALWANALAASGATSEAYELRLASVNHLLDLLHGKGLRTGDAPDPSNLDKCGRLAGEMLESLGRWTEAARLYGWLADELPAQKAAWEAKAARASQRPSG